MAPETDEALVEATRRGARAAYADLIERHQRVVLAASLGATGDRALSEDVAQDTFVVAWSRLGQLREPARLRPWLVGIARNLGRKARRRRQRERPVDGDELDRALPPTAAPFAAASAAEQARLVWDAVARLPPTYREVLLLYYQHEQSAADVAATLGLSEAAVQQRLSRGRQLLAAGVDDLVERALAAAAPPPRFSARVLALLPAAPALPPSSAQGPLMLKPLLALAAVSAAAGTTAWALRADDPMAPAPGGSSSTLAPAPLAATTPAPGPRIAPRANRPAAPGPRPALAPVTLPQLLTTGAPLSTALATRVVDGAPARGPASAPVTITMFTDVVCEFCGRALGALEELEEDYPGLVRLVIRQFPVHAEARLPAQAQLAAHAQGKFWELHEQLAAHPDELSRDDLVRHAAAAGLDAGRLRQALDDGAFVDALAAEVALAREAEVPATPTFFINGQRVVGAIPIDDLRVVLDHALAQAP